MRSATQPQQSGRFGPWAALFVVALGYFINIIDSGVTNVAVPSIATGLNASVGQLSWVLNGYLLTFAMLLLLCGRLGDLVGHRSMFFWGLLLFTVASLACALSTTVTWLIAARVVQGAGAAAMAPQALAVTSAVFPPERRAMAFGVLASVLGSAAAAAPIVGGVLTSAFGWRAIFYFNLPLGAIGLAATYLVLPVTSRSSRQRLPVAASLLLAAGLFLILYTLIKGAEVDWGRVIGPVSAAPLGIAGGLALLAFVAWERTRSNGLLPRATFTRRNYSLMVGASFATYFGIFGTQLVMTYYLQSGLGAGPLEAGLVLSPMWIVASLVAPLSGRLATRLPPRTLLVAGNLAFAAGVGVTALLTAHQLPWAAFIPSLTIAGGGAGLTFAPLTTVAMAEVAPSEFGGASGLIEVVRQLGGAVCVAAVGAILQMVWADALRTRIATASAGSPPAVRTAARDGAARLITQGLHPGVGGPQSSAAGAAGRLVSDTSVGALVSAARPALLLTAVVIVLAAAAAVFVRPTATSRPAESEALPGAAPTGAEASRRRDTGSTAHTASDRSDMRAPGLQAPNLRAPMDSATMEIVGLRRIWHRRSRLAILSTARARAVGRGTPLTQLF